MIKFSNVEELVSLAEERGETISEIMIAFEEDVSGKSRETIWAMMKQNLEIMKQAAERGITEDIKSRSGLTGGDAKRLHQYMEGGGAALAGDRTLEAVKLAMATNEVNAAMGVIVATPTAGSCGVVPGCLLSAGARLGATEDELIKALFTAAALGYVIANNSFISGAAGGCQAEVGSAAAMAAGALVELAGGSPRQSSEALAIALKNMLGLVCDPVAGLVEAPCIKRNAIGAANALVAADLALAGVTSLIPPDEVIMAMFSIGGAMPASLRETAKGGLAATPTGRRLQEQVFGKRREANAKRSEAGEGGHGADTAMEEPEEDR
jgi:L-serine dehydratase